MTMPGLRSVGAIAPEPDDAVVGDLLAVGHPDALALAYERWASLVHGMAVEALGDRGACDVTQTVFVEAWRSRDRFRQQASPRSGLVEITRRTIRDRLDGRRPADVADDVPDAPDGSPPPAGAGPSRAGATVPRRRLQE